MAATRTNEIADVASMFSKIIVLKLNSVYIPPFSTTNAPFLAVSSSVSTVASDRMLLPYARGHC